MASVKTRPSCWAISWPRERFRHDYSIRFTNWDPEVSGEFTRIMEGLFGVSRYAIIYGKEFAVLGKSPPGAVRTAVRP